MSKYSLVAISILIIIASCEEVVNIDLNSANPAFVVEGKMYKDSTCLVRLTQTTSYFSLEEPQCIEDASIIINDGTSHQELSYTGNGFYIGDSVIGTEGKNYEIEIVHDGIIYEGISYMPQKTNLISVSYTKSQSQSILNPNAETVFTITCEFSDNPDADNFYLVRFISDGAMAEDSYYLLTEEKTNDGIINNTNNIISFSESIFYEGGEIDVQVFSIDKSVYNYFLQLNDILFWKRRVMPPTPYNPISNITNGALGYFAAWAFDSRRIILE
ncbi:MAG: DUF4249 domain-containing protein [Bacteroidales bacterium]|nr:DUF4249 domain-containing protein [Bacteroidales bacterium]